MGTLDQRRGLELRATNCWKMIFNPDDRYEAAIERRIQCDEAIKAWKRALTMRRDLKLDLIWRTRFHPYAEVELLVSADVLNGFVHEHAYGDVRLLVQCLLQQERLNGSVDPQVTEFCRDFSWVSARQHIDLLIYLTNFPDLNLEPALDLPPDSRVDTNLNHVCELIRRIMHSGNSSWQAGAVWLLLGIFCETRYCRSRLRKEVAQLQDRYRCSLKELARCQPWFKDIDRDLIIPRNPVAQCGCRCIPSMKYQRPRMDADDERAVALNSTAPAQLGRPKELPLIGGLQKHKEILYINDLAYGSCLDGRPGATNSLELPGKRMDAAPLRRPLPPL